MTSFGHHHDPVKRIFQQARGAGATSIDEYQAKAVLRAFGVVVPRGCLVADLESSSSDIVSLRFPVAVKIVSKDVQHKSDSGFVALNVPDIEQVGAEITRMRDVAASSGISVHGFLVEEMAGSGVEVVIGSFRDETFGPVIMFGLGGIFVEVLRDVSFRVCPIERADAVDMIGELKFNAILDGARGSVPVDRDALVDLLLAIGGAGGLLASFGGEIEELDINPIIMNGRHAVAVDALLVLPETP